MPQPHSNDSKIHLLERSSWEFGKPGKTKIVKAMIFLDEKKLARLVSHATTNKSRKACAGPLMVIIP